MKITPIEVIIVFLKNTSKIQILTHIDSRISVLTDQFSDFSIINRFTTYYLEKYISQSKKILLDYESTVDGYYVKAEELKPLNKRLEALNNEINCIINNQTCKVCNYSSYKKSNYTKHLQTKNHLLQSGRINSKSIIDGAYKKVMDKTNSIRYECKKCHYQTSKKSSMI